MVTCRFNGRLGNNLFQIATAIDVAKKVGTDFVLPEYSYQGHRGSRRVNLDMFEYQFKRGDIDTKYQYIEKTFQYNKVSMIDNLTINGFFQSWKYFESVREELLNKYFIPNKDIQCKLENYIFGAQSMPTLGISVRRGDYLMLQENHCVLSVDYYQEAINKISSVADFEFIYVFSDDIEYCRTIFKDIPVHYVQDDIGTQLFLMSKMDHLILSNSTFAWWGAYLNQRNGVVIAPDPWFGPALIGTDTSDLFLPCWQKQLHEIRQEVYTITQNMFD